MEKVINIRLFNGKEIQVPDKEYDKFTDKYCRVYRPQGKPIEDHGWWEEKSNTISIGPRVYSKADSRIGICYYTKRHIFTPSCTKVIADITEKGQVKTKYVSDEFRPHCIASEDIDFLLSPKVARLVGVLRCANCSCTYLSVNYHLTPKMVDALFPNHEDIGLPDRYEFCPHCRRENRQNGAARANYHSLKRHNLINQGRYGVGIEIEKEDGEVLNRLASFKKVYEKYGWCVEHDGSLANEIGFEAVSPALDLFNEKQINAHLDVMSDVVSATYSKSCGGHIHVSDKDRSPEDLFDDCKGYFAMLYSLYPERAKRNYSLARPKEQLRNANKNAIMLHQKTMEFRIFPSPKNIRTLKWRLELLRIILTHPARTEEEVVAMMTDVTSELFRHLVVGYNSVDKIINKIKMTMAFAKEFESLDLATDLTEAETKVREFLQSRGKVKVEDVDELVNEPVYSQFES